MTGSNNKDETRKQMGKEKDLINWQRQKRTKLTSWLSHTMENFKKTYTIRSRHKQYWFETGYKMSCFMQNKLILDFRFLKAALFYYFFLRFYFKIVIWISHFTVSCVKSETDLRAYWLWYYYYPLFRGIIKTSLTM